MAETIEDLADANVARATRILSRLQPTALLEEREGTMMHRGSLPLPLPFMNTALRLDTSVDASSFVERAASFFGVGCRYAVLTHSHSDADLERFLETQGFDRQGDVPTMLVDGRVDVPAIEPGFRIEAVTGTDGARAFVDLLASAYASLGLPPSMTPAYFGELGAMLDPAISIRCARGPDEAALAGAMVVHTGEVAGVYWVGTIPAARGMGLASACTALVTNEAFDRGARAVTLQASPMGEAAYRKLGYREFGRQRRYCR